MKKSTLKTRLWALAATLLLLVSLLAMPVSAANKPVAGGTFDFDKYLVMDENANVPNVSFTFNIVAGDAVTASGTNHVIYAGDDTNRVAGSPVLKVGDNATGTVTFAPTDTAYTTQQAGDSVTLGSEQKYAIKTITVDFTKVTFKAPGIYRYVITEQKTNPAPSGITYDTNYQRTLDVTVQYKANSDTELEVSGYTFYQTKKTDGSNDDVDPTMKDTGFTNTYATNDLTLKKEVEGNQGDRDMYFKFTVVISNATENNKYTVDLAHATATEITLPNNIKYTNANELTVGAGGTVTATYYLKNDEYIVIQGLTSDTQYKITEDSYANDGYSTTYKVNDGQAQTGSSTPDETAVGDSDVSVTFTNSKSGTVPTGILLETAPYLILGAVVVAGLVVLFATRRRRSRE